MDDDLIKKVEAILFSCGRKIELEELGKLVRMGSPGPLKKALKKLQNQYDERESPLMILEDGEGWKMSVREKYLKTVRKITPYMEFSKSLMETLAVVAWKQPIVQSDVISIRTNKAYEHIAELEKMGFLSKERYGRSYLLKLSQKFYDYFDLRDDIDVRNLFKHIKDIEPEEQKKVVEYSEEERTKEEEEKKLEEPEEISDATTEISEEIPLEEETKTTEDAVVDEARLEDDSAELEVDDEITGEEDKGPEKELEIEEEIAEEEKGA